MDTWTETWLPAGLEETAQRRQCVLLAIESHHKQRNVAQVFTGNSRLQPSVLVMVSSHDSSCSCSERQGPALGPQMMGTCPGWPRKVELKVFNVGLMRDPKRFVLQSTQKDFCRGLVEASPLLPPGQFLNALTFSAPVGLT